MGRYRFLTKGNIMSLVIPFPKNNDKDIVAGVYEIIHKPTGKSYIGSTGNLGSRKGTNSSALRNGKHKNVNLQKAYDENPDIEFKILAITDTAEEALDKEQEFVDDRMPTGTLFNIGIDSRASGRGRRPSPENIERFADLARNREWSDADREHLRQLRTGTKLSEETKNKISAFVNSHEFVEKMRRINTGRKQSEETREKKRQANLGKVQSEETKEKLRELRKDKAKAVIVHGVRYESVKAAARALNANPGSISTMISKTDNPNYSFVYDDELIVVLE